MIISNSTPLIAFARIGQLSLLQKLVEALVIPSAVAREISEYTGECQGVIDLQKETWIEVRSVHSEQPVELLLPTLGQGEAEVVALALELGAQLVLIDELTGRKVAESLGLNVSGSVGILIRAKQLQEITAVKPFLDDMVRQGIYYSQRFIDSVLRAVGEI